MKPLILAACIAAAVGTAGLPPPAAAAASGPPSTQVAWTTAAADADVDRAFAQARVDGRPLLLYWGASWCPPCNQLKATLFNRQEFAALAQSFHAVHVDGDRPGAQKLGRRFKVVGYPTLVLFTPAGQEITRLPGEADAPQVLALLRAGLAGGRAAQAVLGDAVAGKPLPAAEWRMLAFYSWGTDEQQLAPRAEQPALLARLAAAGAKAGADGDAVARLWLKALAGSADAAAGQGLQPAQRDVARAALQRVLADPAAARAQMDVLAGSATDLLRAAEPAGGAARSALAGALDAALQRLASDAGLSRGDRLWALYARLELARIDDPKSRAPLPPPLLAVVRDHAARADREVTDAYERQAVVTGAADALALAGLWDESDALLQANLARSHSPYYLMSQLAGNARKRGRNDEALRWSEKAWQTSVGPATRLQWGAAYLGTLVDLAPQDAPRIEKTATALLDEAAADPAAFEGRSARSLQRAGAKLVAWNGEGRHAAVIAKLQPRLDSVCARVDAGARGDCQGVLKPRPAAVPRQPA